MADENGGGTAARPGAFKLEPIDIEKDAVTVANDMIGAAQAYVARTLVAAADDIADAAVAATNGRAVDILIASSGGFRTDADRAAAVDVELDELTERLTLALPDADRPAATTKTSFAPEIVSGVLASIPAAAETLAKIFAHQYTVSGAELASVHGAVDLRVAGALRARLPHPTSLTVRVERLWTPTESPVCKRIAALVQHYSELQRVLAVAEAAATQAATELTAAEAARTSARAQLVELSKDLATDAAATATSPWSTAWAYATEHADADITQTAARPRPQPRRSPRCVRSTRRSPRSSRRWSCPTSRGRRCSQR